MAQQHADPATVHQYAHWQSASILSLLVLWGPAYRALLDKLWALSGGMALVGQWAQLQSIMDLIAAPAFVGVGMGLTVLVAQRHADQHRPLLAGAMLLGMASALPFAAAALIFPVELTRLLGFSTNESRLIPLAAGAGYLGIALGILNGYWLGQRRTGRVLLVSLVSALPTLIYLIFRVLRQGIPDPATLLIIVLLTQIVIAGVLIYRAWQWRIADPAQLKQMVAALKPLAPFILSGLATGLLTPLSGIVIRSAMADQMDWAAAGTATALWRASDWVLSIANSILYYHFLPRLSLEAANGTLPTGLKRATVKVIVPGIIALVLLYLFQEPILKLLYTSELKVSHDVSALFWGGDALRMFAGLLLFGLYALHANRAIALGEWLSQPLLALLLTLGAAASLLGVGLAHAVTYTVFVLLNLWLLRTLWTSMRVSSTSSEHS